MALSRFFSAACGVALLAASGVSLAEEQDAYLLQSGDELEIVVWNHPELSRNALLREDGTFSFPLLGEVEAAGRTLRETERFLQEELTREYGAIQRKLAPAPSEEVPETPDLPLRVIPPEQASSISYLLRPGDELAVSVWDHSQLNQSVQIREDGFFGFPLVGDVQAAGRSLSEVEREVQERLARDFIVNPQVTLHLLKAQFFVLGAVVKPGTYETEGKMDLLNAISQAGGVQSNATGKIEIIRGEGNGWVMMRLDLDQVLQGTQPNIGIMTRDAIHVKENPQPEQLFDPKDIHVTVRLTGAKFVALGEVESPGTQSIEGPIDLLTAISLAGGLTKFGSSRIEILRTVRGQKTIIRVHLDRILKGKDSNVDVFPRDTIYVRRRLF